MKKAEVTKIIREQVKENRTHQEIKEYLIEQGAGVAIIDKTIKGFASKDFREKFSSHNHVLVNAFIFALVLRVIVMLLSILGSVGDATMMLVYGFVLLISGLIILWLVKLLKYFQFEGYGAALGMVALSARGVAESVQVMLTGNINVMTSLFIVLDIIIFAIITSLIIFLLIKYSKDAQNRKIV